MDEAGLPGTVGRGGDLGELKALPPSEVKFTFSKAMVANIMNTSLLSD